MSRLVGILADIAIIIDATIRPPKTVPYDCDECGKPNFVRGWPGHVGRCLYCQTIHVMVTDKLVIRYCDKGRERYEEV